MRPLWNTQGGLAMASLPHAESSQPRHPRRQPRNSRAPHRKPVPDSSRPSTITPPQKSSPSQPDLALYSAQGMGLPLRLRSNQALFPGRPSWRGQSQLVRSPRQTVHPSALVYIFADVPCLNRTLSHLPRAGIGCLLKLRICAPTDPSEEPMLVCRRGLEQIRPSNTAPAILEDRGTGCGR